MKNPDFKTVYKTTSWKDARAMIIVTAIAVVACGYFFVQALDKALS